MNLRDASKIPGERNRSAARHLRVTLLLYSLFAGGCGKAPELTNIPPQNARICCFGDSLVHGTGADSEDDSYPMQLAAITDRDVTKWGTPGDTTADALNKLSKFDGEPFGIIIVTLGGNDILKRLRWPDTEANLREIFRYLHATGAVLVFTGVTGPLNPTRDKIYADICEELGIVYIPEILDGIKNDGALMADPVHPNTAGYRRIAERIAMDLGEAGLL